MPQVKCKICQKEFYVKPSHQKLGYGKYCSIECRSKGNRRGRNVTCSICNKEIWKSPKELRNSKSGKFFCSRSCQTKWRNKIFSGENHPNWQGGEHRQYRRHMLRSKEKQECKLCGQEDKRVLVVHHIDGNRKNNDLDNLVWLCCNCHHLVHYHNKKI